MMRGLVFLFLFTIASGASGARDAGLVHGYDGITVVLSPQAGNCGIRDEGAFRAQLESSFGEIGLASNAGQPIHAQVDVSAAPLASLDGKCVITVILAFLIPLKADAIAVTKAVANREAVIAALNKIGRVPVVVYEDAEVDAVFPTEAQSQALYQLDQLVQRFAGQR